MDLRDLIDLSFLQEFQDNFASCVGVASLTEDAGGNALTRPSCFTEFCRNVVRATDKGLQRCRQCEIQGGEKAARTGKPAVYHCHAGLVDFAAPIMLEGKQIGAIFGGQILTEPPDEKKFRKIAGEIGINPNKYMAAIKEIPIVPESKVQIAARVLSSVANTFSRIAYQKLKLQEWNRELALANNGLNNILNTMSDGVLIINKEGTVTRVNKITEQIFGKSSTELVNQPIINLVGDKTPCTKLLEQHESYHDIEVLVDSSIGRIHCLSSGTLILDEQLMASSGVIIIRPMEKVQKLINRLSGAHATFKFDDIIGQSPALLKSINMAAKAALGKSNILLEGESGTGKEIFAQAIHNQSWQNQGPFLAINCGAIPRELLGSELFGYADGAFTGAKRGGRPGKFELASGGTLFLDEIGDMPLDQQVALLRVLQEHSLTRIGDDKIIPVDVRIICATNKKLAMEVKKGNFRQDLFYRLNVVSIQIPPLRERREDIAILFNYMLKTIGQEVHTHIKYVNPEVMALLKEYHWPGNVRELQNVVERIVNINDGDVVTLEHLPEYILSNQEEAVERFPWLPPNNEEYSSERERGRFWQEIKERKRIIDLLDHFGGNISKVAKEMNISRSTLYRRIEQYKISI
ncbi:MAG: sigma 54-interacting transcriptional regulator [Syntrophomonadaceae bacterium]|nr:sigma 54-interacting transcriptional regulator [Syntrophomonadaceae bacterium]